MNMWKVRQDERELQVSDSKLRKLGLEQLLLYRCKRFQTSRVKGDKLSFERPHLSRSAIKHCHNVPSCSSAACWKAGRRATGEDTGHHSTTEPQPPTPQHAVTHHANDLLVLDQLHTNHTACTDWTVERLMASINDETSHRGRATVWWTDRARSSCTTHHQLPSADTQSTVRRAESTISLSHPKTWRWWWWCWCFIEDKWFSC